MRRFGMLALLTLALVSTIGATAVAAKPAPVFRAHAGAAVAGGSLHITAKVLHRTRSNAFSATAIVHLSSGDVSVTLKRAGHSFVAGGRVAVPDTATPGPVAVDVTITYGALTQPLTVWGKILPADD